MEPNLITDPKLLVVMEELKKREPIFHQPEFGTKRADFEGMTAAEFWETGASGRRYSREFVLDEVTKRYESPEYRGVKSPPESGWVAEGFHCLEIAQDNYLLTYTLHQLERVTRRATIWRRTSEGWKILYHQGTVVEKNESSGC